MRTKVFIIMVISFLSFNVQAVMAEKNVIPEFILNGWQTYAEKGSSEALKVWLKDSPLENDKNALSQANILQQIEVFYGHYKSNELIDIKKTFEDGHDLLPSS